MSNGTDAPPSINTETAFQIANTVYDSLTSLGSNFGVPMWLVQGVALFCGGAVFTVSYIFLMVMVVAISIGSWFAASFLTLLDTAKDDNKDAINNLLAATINEMLGTNLSGGQLSSGSGAGASMDSNQQVGDSILGLFEGTFGGGGRVAPQTGADNARKFAGFAVNFATSQGFLSILAEAASIGFLKEFHELPEGLMHSLGLGRLQRLALQPLIQNAIQKPYQKYCMAQYRPTELGESQLVKALHNGQMPDDVVRQKLQELGYADDLIDFVLTDFETKLGLNELELLLDNGDVSEQDVINNLTLSGMPEDQARLKLKATQLARVKTRQDALLSWAQSQYIAGFLQEDQWNAILSNLMLSDLEEQAIRTEVGWKQEVPRKTLTFAEVKTGIVDLVLPFDYADAWMKREGYDPDAQELLSYEILKAITAAENKAKYAQYKAAQLRAKGKPVPPWITDAENPVG